MKELTPLEKVIMDIIEDRTDLYGAVNTIEWLKNCGLTSEQIADLDYFEDIEVAAADIREDIYNLTEAVKQMDTIIRNFNDEEIHMYWLTYGLPDYSDEEQIADDVDSFETYEEFAAAFLECISMAKVGGENITPEIAEFANVVELTLYD